MNHHMSFTMTDQQDTRDWSEEEHPRGEAGKFSEVAAAHGYERTEHGSKIGHRYETKSGEHKALLHYPSTGKWVHSRVHGGRNAEGAEAKIYGEGNGSEQLHEHLTKHEAASSKQPASGRIAVGGEEWNKLSPQERAARSSLANKQGGHWGFTSNAIAKEMTRLAKKNK
jgi:hypothetical protein